MLILQVGTYLFHYCFAYPTSVNQALFPIQLIVGFSYQVMGKKSEEGVPTSLHPSEAMEWRTFYIAPEES